MTHAHNYITGRWVLTVKHDNQGNFVKRNACGPLRGLQEKQVRELQSGASTSIRPGFRLLCQRESSKPWPLMHVD
eukprot:8947769-Prorocentrum_lima.AAC.1